ncbi:MAG: UvrD-helicase domain-containing protein, partial [Bacteroidales bacterium]|nr:UvrD-helicase domain-containing protein [Bacteroidales bacterium]
HGLTDDMFYYKGKGVPGFLRALAAGKPTEPKSYVRAALADTPKWSTKAVPAELAKAISAGLGILVAETVAFYDTNIIYYNSAKVVLSGIFSLGILSDILKKVRMIASSGNSFLIADAGELLRDITAGDQAPFIYEKIGNRYENYMIDEFQDTSLMQWDNFLPLMEESMANGNNSIVVGDIKQSIYRFRNSDWRILGSLVDVQIPEPRLVSIPLDTNWRSRSGIIRFNNTIFSLIPENIDMMFGKDPDPLNFSRIYSEAVQHDPGRNPGGYVRMEFHADGQEKVLDRLPHLIEEIQDMGFSASDIGIIVRYGREGTEVLNRMIRYSSETSPENRKKYNYRIVSDYSLTLSNSPAIIFIISTLRVLNDPSDDISRAAMLRYFLLSEGSEDAEKVSLEVMSLRNGSGDHFPDGLSGFMERTAGLPVFEAVESIIGFFGIGTKPWNTAYLCTFQDLVLNFQGKGKNDFRSFLDWWDTTGNASSVVLPAGQDAARIYTIHKSKGLEFRVVILPFISWNDDHNTHHREIMWIRPPSVSPFDELGILPVRYRRNPPPTIFGDLFRQEKYSAFLDNLNLLYVAMTRARDAMFGFAALYPDENSGISKLLREALMSERNPAGERGICPSEYYLRDQEVFEYGEIPPGAGMAAERNDLPAADYSVSPRPESLKLKLHGESYFTSGKGDAGARINYGKLMHRAFEYIETPADIPDAVSSLVREGLIPESESASMIFRLGSLISSAGVGDWFREGNTVIREAGILLPSGEIRRPDRVVIREGRTIVIDFKFGEESPHYLDQIRQYCRIIAGMGYPEVEGWLWYVDRNKTVKL